VVHAKIKDPSNRRRSTVIKLFYFTRGSIIKYFSKTPPMRSLVAQAPAARGNFRLLPAGDCLLLPGITVDECSDWLQHCLMNVNDKIFKNNFRGVSMLKSNSLK